MVLKIDKNKGEPKKNAKHDHIASYRQQTPLPRGEKKKSQSDGICKAFCGRKHPLAENTKREAGNGEKKARMYSPPGDKKKKNRKERGDGGISKGGWVGDETGWKSATGKLGKNLQARFEKNTGKGRDDENLSKL